MQTNRTSIQALRAQVAQHSGVPYQTVYRFFVGETVSPKTQERIRKSIRHVNSITIERSKSLWNPMK